MAMTGWWTVGGQGQSQARAAGGGRTSAESVPGEVFRSERASFSREATRAASDSAELYVGEESVAGSGTGAAGTQARSAPEAAGTAAFARDAAAHRWQPAPVVSGRSLVRLAGDSGRCHQRDLLRATGGGRIDDHRAAGAGGSDRATRYLLRRLQRARQSLLLDASGGRESGHGTSDASGTSVAGIEQSHDSGIFATGAWAIGTGIGNLARATAAGAAPAGKGHAGTSQPVSAGGLRGRIQSAVSGLGVAAGQSIFALPEKGPGRGVLGATAARGEPGQYARGGRKSFSDRADA